MRRTAIISEHALFRQGVGELLRRAGLPPVEAPTYAQLRSAPETIVLDLDHATDDAQELLVDIGARFPATLVVVVGTTLRLAASSNGVAHVELEVPLR